MGDLYTEVKCGRCMEPMGFIPIGQISDKVLKRIYAEHAKRCKEPVAVLEVT